MECFIELLQSRNGATLLSDFVPRSYRSLLREFYTETRNFDRDSIILIGRYKATRVYYVYTNFDDRVST